MRKRNWYIFILLLILAFTGCDKSLRYNKIEVVKYPSKLIYYIGIDNDLDLSDGEIKLTTYAGTTRIFGIEELSPGGNAAFEVTHSVDFSVAGFYNVEIRRTPELSVSITIQVVDLEP